jgi:hypothetical protein
MEATGSGWEWAACMSPSGLMSLIAIGHHVFYISIAYVSYVMHRPAISMPGPGAEIRL